MTNKKKNKQSPNIIKPQETKQLEQPIQNNPNSNNIVNVTIPMIYIPEIHYKTINNERALLIIENEKLNKEIDILKKEMAEYYKNERFLNETIKCNEQTIEILREENKKLKIEVEELKKELKEHKQKIEEQDKEIKKLTKRLDDKESTELFKKYLIAIQDINHDDLLENKLTFTSKQNLIKLKTNRISDCHYLDNNYTNIEKNERRTLFLEKIKNIPSDIKQRFDKMYPKLLEEIEKYIAPQPANLTQQQIDEINLWWE
jgi:hypothetical protein